MFAALMPVAANLHHHAIEMLLKGALSKTMTLKDMKNKLGHKLEKSWSEFKAAANDSSLSRFDKLITELEKFEEIRYPDKLLQSGASMMFDITRAGAVHGAANAPQYKLCLEDVDDLVAEIFKVASRNPAAYLKMMMQPDAKRYLDRINRYL
jgi:hypothetical protein